CLGGDIPIRVLFIQGPRPGHRGIGRAICNGPLPSSVLAAGEACPKRAAPVGLPPSFGEMPIPSLDFHRSPPRQVFWSGAKTRECISAFNCQIQASRPSVGSGRSAFQTGGAVPGNIPTRGGFGLSLHSLSRWATADLTFRPSRRSPRISSRTRYNDHLRGGGANGYRCCGLPSKSL